jgi:uncharacterized membrane-anchored protein YjiN (DUF445 family)
MREMSASPATAPQPHRQRRLARTALLAAAVLAVVSFPFRATWWGGWILAIAEAGIVGGLADWFAVTAIFRHPMGIPIPHTALIPTNWELMAARVGTMVGDRVLTKDFVAQEITRLDLAELLARGAERLTRRDIERGTRTVGRWLTDELPADAVGDLVERFRAFLSGQPIVPMLASTLETAAGQGWDKRVLGGLGRILHEALQRADVRAAVADLLDQVLVRYRRRMGVYPSLLIGLADVGGLIDRNRLITALDAVLARFANDSEDPFRMRLARLLAELPGRLRTDPAFASWVDAAVREVLESKVVGDFLHDMTMDLRVALAENLRRPRSEAVAWVTNRVDAARQALVADAALRDELERWIKQRVVELVERYQHRIAGFIEKGVQVLGPEGAVRLIEEHAGDDLQYIRVNGTVVGGLAGGGLYGIHLILRAL